MTFDLGNRLKDLRKTQNISIKALSEKSGVSTGQISQIEQGKVMPSVICLWKLAEALDTHINYFFEEERPACFVLHPGERKEILVNKGLNCYEMLLPSYSENVMDFVKITLKHNEKYRPEEGVTHSGEECGYVIKGTMVVNVDGKDYELHEGDSIFFKSSIPHYYLNKSKEETVSIWAMTPPFF